MQERDIYRPSVFMELQVGEFIGRTVESATPVFHGHFKQVDSRCRQLVTEQPERFVLGSDVMDYYKQVREDIKSVLGQL